MNGGHGGTHRHSLMPLQEGGIATHPDGSGRPGSLAAQSPGLARTRLFGVGVLTIRGDRILEIDLVADPDRLRRLELAVLDD